MHQVPSHPKGKTDELLSESLGKVWASMVWASMLMLSALCTSKNPGIMIYMQADVSTRLVSERREGRPSLESLGQQWIARGQRMPRAF